MLALVFPCFRVQCMFRLKQQYFTLSVFKGKSGKGTRDECIWMRLPTSMINSW